MRYSLINRQKLAVLLGIKDNDQLSEYHRNWIEEVLKNGMKDMSLKNPRVLTTVFLTLKSAG